MISKYKKFIYKKKAFKEKAINSLARSSFFSLKLLFKTNYLIFKDNYCNC